MNARTVYVEPIKTPPTFPALYRAKTTRDVVLFTDDRAGTCLATGNEPCRRLGEHLKTWTPCTEDHWEKLPANEELRLCND